MDLVIIKEEWVKKVTIEEMEIALVITDKLTLIEETEIEFKFDWFVDWFKTTAIAVVFLLSLFILILLNGHPRYYKIFL